MVPFYNLLPWWPIYSHPPLLIFPTKWFAEWELRWYILKAFCSLRGESAGESAWNFKRSRKAGGDGEGCEILEAEWHLWGCGKHVFLFTAISFCFGEQLSLMKVASAGELIKDWRSLALHALCSPIAWCRSICFFYNSWQSISSGWRMARVTIVRAGYWGSGD